MVNGKKGDAPLTDIIFYGATVFHPKVDQLIRELSEEGAFSDPFAADWVNAMHLIWEHLDSISSSRGLDPEVARSNWIRNFAHTLGGRLLDLRGEKPTVWRLPPEWDPTI